MELGAGDKSGSSDENQESRRSDKRNPPPEVNRRESDAHLDYSDLAAETFTPNRLPRREIENAQIDTIGADSGNTGTELLENSGTNTIDNSPDTTVPGGVGHPHAPQRLQLEGGYLAEGSQHQYDGVLGVPGHTAHPIAGWQQPGQSYLPPNLYGYASVGQNESVDRSTFYMPPYPPTHPPGPMQLQQGYYVHPPPGYPGGPALPTLNGGYPGGVERPGVAAGNALHQRPPDRPYQFNPQIRSESQPSPGYPHSHPSQGQWPNSQPLLSGMEAHWNASRGQPTNQSVRPQGGHPGPESYRYQPYSVSRPPQRPPSNDDSSSSMEMNDRQARRSTPTTRQIRAMQDNRTKVKKHHCDTCPMQFERPSNLRVHQRTHTGARPFMCSECGKAFTTASNMTRHRRRLHAELFGVKPTPPKSSGDGPSQRTRQPTIPQDMIE